VRSLEVTVNPDSLYLSNWGWGDPGLCVAIIFQEATCTVTFDDGTQWIGPPNSLPTADGLFVVRTPNAGTIWASSASPVADMSYGTVRPLAPDGNYRTSMQQISYIPMPAAGQTVTADLYLNYQGASAHACVTTDHWQQSQ
jgi:hypothetical protein